MTEDKDRVAVDEAVSRLDGWKEIAAYLKRGVRTAHRWERELGLPVHRMRTEKGEIVFAFRQEIDAWQSARETGSEAVASREDADEAPGEPAELPESRQANSGAKSADSELIKRSKWRLTSVATAGLLVTVAASLWIASGRATRRSDAIGARAPASWDVGDRSVSVFDSDRRVLWEHRFDFTLDTTAYSTPNLPPLVAITDLENDGTPEVLFVPRTKEAGDIELYCFNNDGTLRFKHQPQRTVTFGSEKYGPPFPVSQFLLASGSDGKRDIWLVAQHHLWFPTVVQKLSTDGHVEAEYWSNGHVPAIKDFALGSRRIIALGGTSNEHNGATLTILNYDNAGGSAPASNPSYLCNNCPTGRPLAFFVVPRTDVSRILESRPYVKELRLEPAGTLLAGAQQGTESFPGEPNRLNAPLFYRLNSSLEITGTEVGDAYRDSHARLELLGKLDHRFGAADVGGMQNVMKWDGERFRLQLPAK